MANQPFQILGTSVPRMVARESEFKALVSEIDRSSPNHVSVIGPRFSGKSVLLQSVSKAQLPFTATVLWDLAHFTPEGDDGFRESFAKRLADHPASELDEYRKLLREDSSFSSLKTVFEDLRDRKLSILMLWDGFDRPLERGRYSRNLWDQFLDLISKTPLCLVTASRLSLRELIRNEESASSKFWECFGRTITIRPFSAEDCDQILGSLTGMSFDKGSRTELTSWSGCFAPLYLTLINEVVRSATGAVTATDVNEAAVKVADDRRDLIRDIWADCPSASQEVFGELLEVKESDIRDFPPLDVEPLILRGLAVRNGSKLRASCRLVNDVAASEGLSYGYLKRAFGDPETFAPTSKRAIAIRLSSLQGLDERLRTHLHRCLEDIPRDVGNCMNQLRSVFDRAIDLLLEAELGSDLSLSNELTDPWLQNNDWQRICTDVGHAPTSAKQLDRLPRLLLLRLLANPPSSIERKARKVSRTCYELAQVCKTFDDFGNHTKGEIPSTETALAAMTVAIQFVALVQAETATMTQPEGRP